MLRDIVVMLWKEREEMLHHKMGRHLAEWHVTLASMVVLGAYFAYGLRNPAQVDLTHSPAVWGVGIALMQVADTFAGERERRTLEALLATPLADAAVFIGKVAFVILYGITSVVVFQLSWCTVVIYKFGFGGIQSDWLVRGTFIAALLVAFVALAGGLVSLRSRTVKEAQITMATIVIATMISFGIAAVGLVNLLRRLDTPLPDRVTKTLEWAFALPYSSSAYLSMCIALVLINCFLLGFGAIRFERDQLIG